MKKAEQSHTSSRTKGDGDFHCSRSSLGMGDYYGSGLRQKLGRVRESYYSESNPTPPSKLKIPPKNLA
jgi:hypothetical protein